MVSVGSVPTGSSTMSQQLAPWQPCQSASRKAVYCVEMFRRTMSSRSMMWRRLLTAGSRHSGTNRTHDGRSDARTAGDVNASKRAPEVAPLKVVLFRRAIRHAPLCGDVRSRFHTRSVEESCAMACVAATSSI